MNLHGKTPLKTTSRLNRPSGLRGFYRQNLTEKSVKSVQINKKGIVCGNTFQS